MIEPRQKELEEQKIKELLKNKKKRALVKKQISVRLLGNEKSSLVVVHYTLKDFLKAIGKNKKKELIFNKLFDTLQYPLNQFLCQRGGTAAIQYKEHCFYTLHGRLSFCSFLFVIFVVSSSFEFININFNINFTLVIKRRQLEKRYYVDILLRYSLMCLGLEEIFV